MSRGSLVYKKWRSISLFAVLVVFALLTSIRATTVPQETAPTTRPHHSATGAKKAKARASAPPQAAVSDQTDETSGPSVSGIRANNVGVALMDAHRFSEAFSNFQTACIMVADSDTGCLNSGIALVAMKQYGEARKILSTSVSRDPQSGRGWFNLGLLDRDEGHTDAALADFQKAAALDPRDADTQCLIGLGYMSKQQFNSAFAVFQAALKIDPSNAAAESGATEALSKMGSSPQQTGAETTSPGNDSGNAQILGDNYGQQGKYSLALEIPPPDSVAAAIPVHFVDVTHESGLVPPRPVTLAPDRGTTRTKRIAAEQSAPSEIHSLADFLGSGACVFDYDGDGRPDIFLLDADGSGNAALYRNLGHGHFADVTKTTKIDFHGQGMGCSVGDYDNDGHPDLALSFNGGVRLFHNGGKGTFTDVTATSGIQPEGLAMGLSFVDYDRDGNLDLFVTRFRNSPLGNPSQPFAWPADDAPGNMMWHNNGDGTFSDVTESIGLAGEPSSTGTISDQFGANGTEDFLLTGLGATPSLVMNARTNAFEPASWWGAETQGPTAGGVSFDFDKDGFPDVALTHWQATTLGLWHNVSGKSFERVALPDPGWMRAWGIATLDYDNDGWIDLVAVGETFSGEGRIVLLRNEGGKGFHDVTPDTGLDKIALHDPRSVIAFDADGDGSVDLLITQNHRPPMLLKAVGRNKHNWTQIAFAGSTINRMALGLPVEMISGALRQAWEVPGASGYLSQGPAIISSGLGDEELDALRIHWSPNTVDVRISLRPDQKLLITQGDIGKGP